MHLGTARSSNDLDWMTSKMANSLKYRSEYCREAKKLLWLQRPCKAAGLK